MAFPSPATPRLCQMVTLKPLVFPTDSPRTSPSPNTYMSTVAAPPNTSMPLDNGIFCFQDKNKRDNTVNHEKPNVRGGFLSQNL